MRKALTKSVRFRVFARDEFVCQYCGRKPPEVVLEVDHIIPVSKDGSNEDHNLLTSCFDCNRGKAASSLKVAPIDVSARAEILKERLAQVRAYEAILRKEKKRAESDIDDVNDAFKAVYPERCLSATGRTSVRKFLEHLAPSEVIAAMEMAVSRTGTPDHAFKYFCGVCWRKIKGDGNGPN